MITRKIDGKTYPMVLCNPLQEMSGDRTICGNPDRWSVCRTWKQNDRSRLSGSDLSPLSPQSSLPGQLVRSHFNALSHAGPDNFVTPRKELILAIPRRLKDLFSF